MTEDLISEQPRVKLPSRNAFGKLLIACRPIMHSTPCFLLYSDQCEPWARSQTLIFTSVSCMPNGFVTKWLKERMVYRLQSKDFCQSIEFAPIEFDWERTKV